MDDNQIAVTNAGQKTTACCDPVKKLIMSRNTPISRFVNDKDFVWHIARCEHGIHGLFCEPRVGKEVAGGKT